MKVEVRLYGILRQESPEGTISRMELELEPGITAGVVLERFAASRKGRATLIVINGQLAEPQQLLAEGDEIRLIPAASGG